MSVWDRIEKCKPDFTPREMEIYEILKKDPYSFSAGTAMELSRRYGVAQSAVSRFCQKVGFSGFADFRLSLAVGLANERSGLDESSSQGSANERYCHTISQTVLQLGKTIKDETIDALARRILGASHVYASGYGSSMLSAQAFAFTLSLCSVPSHCIPASQEMESLHYINITDIVFLFSASNPSHRDFLNLVMDLPPEKRPYIVLISSTSRHPLRHKVSEMVLLADWDSQSGGAFIVVSQTVPQYVFGLMLVDRVKQFKAAEIPG